ncbi:MAG: GNAT family N-acetyltransferase [Gammaproteobacteria bacterium]
MRAEVHKSIDDIDLSEWNALGGTHSPFLRHEFLAALEHTGCVGKRTGWAPSYVTLSDAEGIAAAAPVFAKSHSRGEFVFDWGWADAYQRVGLDYYPKLSVAVPFTPATGPRLLVRPGLDAGQTSAVLLSSIESLAEQNSLSSAHALFVNEADRETCERAGWLLRRDCQFHWTNRDYADFDAFLETFTAEKRKKARRERRRVAEAGVTFDTHLGGEMDSRLLDRVYAFHRDTFRRHGHEPYLTRAFFTEIARTLPEALMVKVAQASGEAIACAIFFQSSDTLYGRYWGAGADLHSLHFETCYHQGVDYCIERGLKRFEPGTQGEHKVARGFEPTLTWSAHFITDSRFRAAIDDYLVREGPSIDAYAEEIREHVPFRNPQA